MARLADSGVSTGEPVESAVTCRISSGPLGQRKGGQGLSDDPGTAAQRSPRIGADAQGSLTVLWLDEHTSPAQLRMSTLAARPSTWSASVVVSEEVASGRSASVRLSDGPARGADTFSYDPLDRLTASTVAGISRSYAYSADGLIQSRTQGATTTFLWDPSTSGPSRLLQVGSERIVHGLGPLYAERADGSTLAFARDGLGSVRAEVDGSGAVSAAFRYRAYGELAQS